MGWKRMNPNKIFVAIIVSIIFLATSPLLIGLLWPKISDVRTGETPQYPDIQPQRFSGLSSDAMFNAALSVARSLGWEIREADREQGLIEAVAIVPILRLHDDVTVMVGSEPGSVVVNIRSRSRAGKIDYGRNARRIRKFQSLLAPLVEAAVKSGRQ